MIPPTPDSFLSPYINAEVPLTQEKPTQEYGSAVVDAHQDPLAHKSEVLTGSEGQVGQDQDQ